MNAEKLNVQYAEKATWMYLNTKEKAKASLKLRLPHQPNPLSVKKVEAKFPEFAKQVDGKLADSVITFWWKLDKYTGVYEFVDDDAKEEVAELMGVENVEYEIPDPLDEKDDPASRRQLSEQEIQDFRDYLADCKEGRKKLGWETADD
jgi:hypothetical protein